MKTKAVTVLILLGAIVMLGLSLVFPAETDASKALTIGGAGALLFSLVNQGLAVARSQAAVNRHYATRYGSQTQARLKRQNKEFAKREAFLRKASR